ncbi:MAG: YncE family protein [Burkholderiales bacterium]
MKRLHSLLILAALSGVPSLAAYAAQFEKVVDLPLPGAPARFDYEAFDPASGRLYINKMGANQLLVYDVRARRLVAALSGFPRATGITLAAQRGLAFVSTPGGIFDSLLGHDGLRVLRLSDLKTIASLRTDEFPDGSAWVNSLGRLFVSNERGGVETIIGGDPLRVLKTLPLGGEAGNSAYAPSGHRVLVNVQSRRELLTIDPQALVITRRITLPATCIHNHGLLVDDSAHLIFVACDGNARLLTLALPGLETVQIDIVGEDPDVLALDTQRQILYVASESGVVTVFAVETGKLKCLWRGWIGPDAHSVAVDPASGLTYFPLADVDGHPLLRVMRLVTP